MLETSCLRNKKILIETLPNTASVVGGAASVFIELSNLFYANNYNVTGVYYGNIEGRPSRLNNGIRYINLYSYYSKDKQYSEAMNAYIEELKPDLIIFFFPYMLFNAQLDSKFDNIPKILMLHSRPDYYAAQSPNFDTDLMKCSKNLFIQVLLPEYANLVPAFINKDNIVCIPNFVDTSKEKVNYKEKKKIVYLSRVDNKKGCDFLINSFSKIAERYRDWQLDIWGQSEPSCYVEKLKKMVKKRGLEKQIFFKGVTDDPQKTLLDYDFCVFPSLFEGFPVGLVETLNVGLPAIGLKGASGVNELIQDGYNGYLAEYNEKQFAGRIEELINRKTLREEFGKNAAQSVLQYDTNNFKTRWLNFADNVLNGWKKTDNKIMFKKKDSCAMFPLSVIFEKEFQSALDNIPLLKKIFSIVRFRIWGKKYKVLYILGKAFIIKKKNI